jgi:hypothetical protein
MPNEYGVIYRFGLKLEIETELVNGNEAQDRGIEIFEVPASPSIWRHWATQAASGAAEQ